MKRLLVFASGSKTGGGSGFQKLVEATRDGRLAAEVVAVVSQHADGGVRRRAEKAGIPFVHFNGPWREEAYQVIARLTRADFVSLSGWLKPVRGLDPRSTVNIHPGPLPRFGGRGMYGLNVHRAVLEAFEAGELTHTEVTMHFVTEAYDDGPVFFRRKVPLVRGDTPEMLARRVLIVEHQWQAWVTNLVVLGLIRWDGRDPASLTVPQEYRHL